MVEWFDPVALHLGPFSIKWYGIAYVIGILLATGWARYLSRSPRYPHFTYAPSIIDAYITYAVMGIVIGGRLGYCFFYRPLHFMTFPLEIVKTWEGGMSFHGGLIGVALATWLFAHRYAIYLPRFYDLLALCSPLGLFMGRLANFINAEHIGHPTTLPWGIIFPGGDLIPRHPSQLYEAFLEGIILFIVLNFLHSCKQTITKTPGFFAGYFLIGYSCARMISEFFRLPEPHLDIFPFGITYGHILSLVQILVAIIWMISCRQRAKTHQTTRSSTL